MWILIKGGYNQIHIFVIIINYKKYLNRIRIITFEFYRMLVMCYSKSSFHEMHIEFLYS